MEELPATPSAMARTWQKDLVARTASPSVAPWWEELLRSRAVVAVGAFVLALLLLAVVNPPIVQKTSDNAFETATLSLPKLVLWSAAVGVIVYVAPYAWSALQGCSS